MKSPDINIITITTVKGLDYHCIIYGDRKYDVIHLLENSGRKHGRRDGRTSRPYLIESSWLMPGFQLEFI